MDVDKTHIEKGKQLANEHWSYIESLLVTHKVDKQTIDIVKFHYISAFIHGYKHGLEESIKNSV